MSHADTLSPVTPERWTLRDLILAAGALALLGLVTFALAQRDQILSHRTARVQPIGLLTTADFHALAFDPNDPNVVYFGHHNGVLKSANGAVDWQTSMDNGDAMSLSVSSDEPNIVIAAGHLLLRRSTDHGATWNEIPNDLPYTDIHGFALNPDEPREWFAYIVGYGLYRSRDAGAHWVYISDTLPETTMGLLVVPDDPPMLLAGTMDRGVLKSIDRGLTWTTANVPVQMAMTLAQDPREPRIVYAGTEAGLWGLNPEGTRWEQVGLNNENLMAIAISPANPQRLLAVDANGRVYRSEDGGRTW